MTWPLRATGIGQNPPFPQPLPPRPFRGSSPRPRVPCGSASRSAQSGAIDVSFDRGLVRELLAHLITDPDAAMEYFYARLFADNPGLRGLFPYAMTQTRAAVFGMLASIVGSLDDEQATRGRLWASWPGITASSA